MANPNIFLFIGGFILLLIIIAVPLGIYFTRQTQATTTPPPTTTGPPSTTLPPTTTGSPQQLTPAEQCASDGKYWYYIKRQCLDAEPTEEQVCIDLNKYWDSQRAICSDVPLPPPNPQRDCQNAGKYWDAENNVCLVREPTTPAPGFELTLPAGLVYGGTYSFFNAHMIDTALTDYLGVDLANDIGKPLLIQCSDQCDTSGRMWISLASPTGNNVGLSNTAVNGFLGISNNELNMNASNISRESNSIWVIEDNTGTVSFRNLTTGQYLAKIYNRSNNTYQLGLSTNPSQLTSWKW